MVAMQCVPSFSSNIHIAISMMKATLCPVDYVFHKYGFERENSNNGVK